MTTIRRLAPLTAALALATVLPAAGAPGARADSTSSYAPPAQYRGPSSEVAGGLSSLFLPQPPSGSNADSPEAWARWEFWFEYSKDRLLRDARERIARDERQDPALRIAGAPPGPQAVRPEDRAALVSPALAAMAGATDPVLRGSALLAQGGAADPSALPALTESLRRGAVSDRRSAALALGSLGDAAAAAALERALREDDDSDVRSYATLSLGLLGGTGVSTTLRAHLQRNLPLPGRDNREQRVALITALGLAGDRESVPLLVDVLGSRQLRDDRARAHAAVALGRLADVAAVPRLLAVLTEDGDAGVRRGAALALGSFQDPGTTEALRAALAEDGDALVRGFAAISLARAAGPRAVETLAPLTAVRHSRSLRGFAAVALGLTGSPRDAAPVLRALLDLRSETSVRGAAAIGLGLLGDAPSAARLRGMAADEASAPELRAHALLGAVLSGDPACGVALRSALGEDAPPELRRAAALGAGVRPFEGSPALLVHTLLTDRDPTVRGAAVLGLGLAPDRGVLPLLVEVAAAGARRPAAQRLAAVTALGEVGRGGSLPVPARLAGGVDWRSLPPALDAATRTF